MKNVFLALCFACGFSSVALAGDCAKCQPVRATVTQTVEVTKTVVTTPVRVTGGIRSRIAARRAVRLAAACAACSPAPAAPAAE